MTFDITEWEIKLDDKAIANIESSDEVISVLTTLAQAGEASAKQHAPFDTGNLRRSITHEVFRGRNPYARVGTNVIYAVYQEIGTRLHPAHPFMRPAMEAVRRLVRGL